MSYEKQEWVDAVLDEKGDVTNAEIAKITADKLNHIEGGIEAAASDADTNKTAISANQNSISALDMSVNSLQSSVSDVQSSLSSVQSSVSSVQSSLSSVQSSVNTITGALSVSSSAATFSRAVNVNSDLKTTGSFTANCIELTGSTTTNYIDFHYGASSSDYTSRIIEGSSGALTFTCSNGASFSGAMTVAGQLNCNGAIYMNNGLYVGNGKYFRYANSAGTYVYMLYMGTTDVQHFGTPSKAYATQIHGTSITCDVSPTTSSDARLKTDFATLAPYDAVFDALKPLSFRYIDGGGTNLGFTYQDVVKALSDAGIDPESTDIVSKYLDETSGEEYGGIAYEQLIALLVYEVQTLKAEVKELKEAKEAAE